MYILNIENVIKMMLKDIREFIFLKVIMNE